MDTVLAKKIKQLEAQIEVMTNEYGTVDVAMDGLMPKEESAPVITGLMGGKGALANGTDIDDVMHGGSYYLPSENTYKNVPYGPVGTGNYRAQLDVIRNYGGNPRTDNPLCYQRYMTIELSGQVKTAYRFYYNKWLNWFYPSGKTIWNGSQSTNGSNFTLSEPYSNFLRIKIYWSPYNKSNECVESLTGVGSFSLDAVNVPNSVGSSPALSMEEVILTSDSSNTVLTATDALYYIQNGVTYGSENIGKSVINKIVGYIV
ncbi:hypothetical protein [Loigolactobacillus zhaoyuanensis]|uniref:hypothetical protein n=1 Tax=Loigolactobacillus zhaoyuanensis TaxID=2486017 RepID=UPI000F746B6E|nr:hypothetical protein [Loigolactobacillus zhaoyuanensis]